jgi:hypothetical protein
VNNSCIPEGDFKTSTGTLDENWSRWNQESELYLCHKEDKREMEYKGRGRQVAYVKNTIAPPQDNTEGFAITEEMRRTQHTMNRMRKYQMLTNKKQQYGEEGQVLNYKLEGKVALHYLKEIEEQMDNIRNKLKHDRTQRWKTWVETSWANKKKDIYKWIRGKDGNGPLIMNKGGSAQMSDRMKLAEETWGGLWAVEVEDLPHFGSTKMPIITEDEVRRVVNNLTDGKAKGIDGWSPAELRSLSKSHIRGLTDLLNRIEKEKRWPDGLNPIIALIATIGAENEGQLRPIAILPYVYRFGWRLGNVESSNGL